MYYLTADSRSILQLNCGTSISAIGLIANIRRVEWPEWHELYRVFRHIFALIFSLFAVLLFFKVQRSDNPALIYSNLAKSYMIGIVEHVRLFNYSINTVLFTSISRLSDRHHICTNNILAEILDSESQAL